jgi:hypothetical protein
MESRTRWFVCAVAATTLMATAATASDRRSGRQPEDGGEQAVLWRGNPETEPLETSNEELLERIVRTAYDQLAKYASQGGRLIRFELSDFRTYQRAELDQVAWSDLAALPGGRFLQVTRHEIGAARSADRRLQYIPQWKDTPEVEADDAGEFAAMDAKRVLRLATVDMPELARVSAATSYNVTVTYQGEWREYRAAFFWIQESRGIRLVPYDSVSHRVGEAIGETVLPGDQLPWSPPAVGPLLKAPRACLAKQNNEARGFPVEITNGTKHKSGVHGVKGFAYFQCHCFADCSQQLIATPQIPEPIEWGETKGFGSYHKISDPSVASANGYSPNSLAAGADGKDAFGVTWMNCFTSVFCGAPSISLGYAGQGISVPLNVVADPPTAITTEQPFTCQPCEQVAICGNRVCESALGESHASCPGDCPAPRKKRARKPCKSMSSSKLFDVICEDLPEGEPGYDTCEEAIANEPDPICPGPICDNGVCEPGETVATCPSDCQPQGCNWNGACEPWRGETSLNCPFDCPEACTPCLGRVCGPDPSCGQQSCGTCPPGELCDPSGRCYNDNRICFPDNVPFGACGSFWSSNCQRYVTVDCQPGEACSFGTCTGGGGGGLPDRPDCNCGGATWGCTQEELYRLWEAFCIEEGGQN